MNVLVSYNRNTKTLVLTLFRLRSNKQLESVDVFIRVSRQQVLKREQVSNPFWAEAISGTELPKGLNLVQQTIAQLRTILLIHVVYFNQLVGACTPKSRVKYLYLAILYRLYSFFCSGKGRKGIKMVFYAFGCCLPKAGWLPEGYSILLCSVLFLLIFSIFLLLFSLFGLKKFKLTKKHNFHGIHLIIYNTSTSFWL